MTDSAVVARKLAGLTDHLARLRERRPETLQALKASSLLQDAIALSVLVVVQEALDIALHIASDEGWGLPASHREAFELLAKHGVIEAQLASRLASAAALRNRIAHGYGTVDVDRLWAELPSGVASFDAYASAIAAFLQSASAGSAPK